MIPAQNIVAWGNVVPWADQRQVEQDPIISRALVEIFADDMLRDALRVRGGTALNKLHFPAPLRYSEDIDLVRTAGGPSGRSSTGCVSCWSLGSGGRNSVRARSRRSSAFARRPRTAAARRSG